MPWGACSRSVLFAVILPVLPGTGLAYAETLPPTPSIQASSLYLVDLQSRRVLLEKHAGRRLPPASLTKLMTALVALEAASPEQVVPVDGRALIHRSSLKLQPGEQFLLRDLLAAMLVTSANDACEAIAWHVGGGSPDRFVAMMNARAESLGLHDTHFVNACGFDAPGHYSTAMDLAALAEQALSLPAISMIVRTVTRTITTVDGSRSVSLYSTNELLRDPDVTGVKTGYTSKAGRCLIASLFRNGHRLLLVGLNVRNRWEQATRLLRYAETVLQQAPG